MSRTPGALNKRTRVALEDVKKGDLDANGLSSAVRYVLRVMADSKKPDALRLEAAKAAAPYLQPKLASVELNQGQPEDVQSQQALMGQLAEILRAHPSLVAELTKYIKLDQALPNSPAIQH